MERSRAIAGRRETGSHEVPLSLFFISDQPLDLSATTAQGYLTSTKRFVSQSKSAVQGARVTCLSILVLCIARVSEPRETYGNGSEEAACLDGRRKQVKGMLGAMKNGYIRLCRGTRAPPAITTWVDGPVHTS